MDLTFLGTSSGSPTADRNVTGLARRTNGGWDLFDCGEATQHQLLRTSLSLSRLRRVFISHLHGDHCFGLFGLLGSRSLAGGCGPLTIFGPSGLRRMVTTVLEASSTHLTYELIFREVDPGGERVVDEHGEAIDAVPLTHRVTSLAWFIQEHDRRGAFRVSAAAAAGVPEGPLFGRLQRGEDVDLSDGRRVSPSDVLGPARPGRRLVIAGDNSAPQALFERTGPVDVAVHEATYTEAVLAVLGDDRGHSTAARVAKAAEAFGVRNLVLTHFSPRYLEAGDGPTVDHIRAEAITHFSRHLHLARDFDRLEISRDGDLVAAAA